MGAKSRNPTTGPSPACPEPALDPEFWPFLAANQAGRAWTRRAERQKANRERAQARADAERKAIDDMTRAVARGMPEGQAMARAHRAGVSWVRIAEHFGMAQQTAHYRAKVWTKRGRTVRTYRSRQ